MSKSTSKSPTQAAEERHPGFLSAQKIWTLTEFAWSTMDHVYQERALQEGVMIAIAPRTLFDLREELRVAKLKLEQSETWRRNAQSETLRMQGIHAEQRTTIRKLRRASHQLLDLIVNADDLTPTIEDMIRPLNGSKP